MDAGGVPGLEAEVIGGDRVRLLNEEEKRIVACTRLVHSGAGAGIRPYPARTLAKFWLDPVAQASASGFQARELRELERLVNANRHIWLEAWHEFSGS